MSRVKLTDIPALTLYSGEPTLSRRGQPIRQLVCKGDACKLFTPDVIRCVNLGGEGTEVDWKVRPYHTSCRGPLRHPYVARRSVTPTFLKP
jgi:SOCE-associated regulatory factor of calcium homoeostasis